ncbi:MAG TPA: hypothetical protein PKO15_06870 [Fibrobacteria bacterium]|nr:hypothetical protein [Fibrobacteria bacterium]HOX50938.1 hypothetical protein [Fibrobacteria bacterium]
MWIVAGVSVLVGFAAEPVFDTFGIERFLPTAAGTRLWNSLHWANGKARNLKYASDPFDPTDWTEDHSGSTDGFWIDGTGTLRLSGGSPRFHLNSLKIGATGSQFFLNTEFTTYYRHWGNTKTDYGGLVVGARSGPLGHASSGGDDCDATTYYARFRNDGKWDFEKELKHPSSDYWSGGGFHTQSPLWGGSRSPTGRWFGMKYLVWNRPDGKGVHLEAWIDSVSGGDVAKAVWKKVGAVEDTGTFAAAASAISGCTYTDERTIISQGHGTFLWRTDGDTAEYKYTSLREIVPPSDPSGISRSQTSARRGSGLWTATGRSGVDVRGRTVR